MLKCQRNARYMLYIYSFAAAAAPVAVAVAFKQGQRQRERQGGDSSCLLLLRRAGKPSVNNNAYL